MGGGEFMPKLKIDDLEIEVPKGMKVIEAAETAWHHHPPFLLSSAWDRSAPAACVR